MRRDDERAGGLSHRLWWLAAIMSIAVSLHIVLAPAQTATPQPPAPAHAAHDAAGAPRGG
jgi:hypothetical protein